MQPDAFADACRWIVENHDGDEAHRMLDETVTSLLTTLGYGAGMEIFMAHVAPHHAPIARIEARSGETQRGSMAPPRKPDQRQTIPPHITRGRG